MAWQSLSGMGVGGNGGGNGGGDPGQLSNQPQGTEYTLQGMYSDTIHEYKLELTDCSRCYAIPPNRMASARTRSQWLGNRETRNEREDSKT
jgi:hypothetical protein